MADNTEAGGDIDIRLSPPFRLAPPFEVWMTGETYESLKRDFESYKRDAQRYRALRAVVKQFGYLDDSWDLDGTPEAFDRYADAIRSRRGIE